MGRWFDRILAKVQIYEEIDDETVLPVTAYEVPKGRRKRK